MRYASVILDIPTRQLDQAYTYAMPAELAAEAQVGTTVLVTFSHRHAVGYVVSLAAEPPCGLDLTRIAPIERVLAPSAFDEAHARVALWMAREYACPPSEALPSTR